jgi:putative flippase GtrA
LKISKSILLRLFWFVVGGVCSIAVNECLFWLFHDFWGWDRRLAYGLSLTIITVLLFLWNYVVGFKTNRHWTESAWRQVVCQIVAFALNYVLVLFLHGFFPEWMRVIIAAVQVFIAFFKFGLYHYWVYPQHVLDLPAAEALTSELSTDSPREEAKL